MERRLEKVVVLLRSDASDISSSSSTSSSDEIIVVLFIDVRVEVEAFDALDRCATGSLPAALEVGAVAFDTGRGGLNGRRRFAAGGMFVVQVGLTANLEKSSGWVEESSG